MKRVFLASLYLAILSLLYWLIVIGLYIYTPDLPPTFLWKLSIGVKAVQSNMRMRRTIYNGFMKNVKNYIGGAYRNRTDVHGFAIRCITTLPTRRA